MVDFVHHRYSREYVALVNSQLSSKSSIRTSHSKHRNVASSSTKTPRHQEFFGAGTRDLRRDSGYDLARPFIPPSDRLRGWRAISSGISTGRGGGNARDL